MSRAAGEGARRQTAGGAAPRQPWLPPQLLCPGASGGLTQGAVELEPRWLGAQHGGVRGAREPRRTQAGAGQRGGTGLEGCHGPCPPWTGPAAPNLPPEVGAPRSPGPASPCKDTWKGFSLVLGPLQRKKPADHSQRQREERSLCPLVPRSQPPRLCPEHEHKTRERSLRYTKPVIYVKPQGPPRIQLTLLQALRLPCKARAPGISRQRQIFPQQLSH